MNFASQNVGDHSNVHKNNLSAERIIYSNHSKQNTDHIQVYSLWTMDKR